MRYRSTLLLLLLCTMVFSNENKKQRDFYDLSMGAIEVGIAEKPHLRISVMEIGIPLKNESLFLSAPIGSIAISPIFSRDTHHFSLNAIPPLIAAVYLLFNDNQYSKRSKVLLGILAGPHMISNAKLTAYAGRFDFYLRQRTDFHLLDRTKIGVYSESNFGIGCNVFRSWNIGLFGALPVLKTLPYKPQEPYIGAQVYLSF